MAIKCAVIKQAAFRQVLLNPDFTGNANNWSIGTGWVYGSNRLNATNATGDVSQTVAPLTAGVTYRVCFSLANVTKNGVQIVCGTTLGINSSVGGTYYETIVSDGTGFKFQCVNADGEPAQFTGRLDAVYCVPLTETFTKSGFGTVIAAKFTLGQTHIDGTEQGDASIGRGFTDGTQNYCLMGTSEGLVSTTDSYRRISNTKCIGLISSADGTLLAGAAFSSFPTDGVTIVWDDTIFTLCTPAEIPIMTIEIFGGTDPQGQIQAYAGTYSFTATGSGDETPHVDVGPHPHWEPDIVESLYCESAAAFDTTYNGLRLSIGFADNGDSITQSSLNMTSVDAVSTSSLVNQVSTAYLARPAALDATYAIEVTGFDATGFTLSTTTLTSGIGAFLAFKLNGFAGHWCGIAGILYIGGTNALSITPLMSGGFTPQFMELLLSGSSAKDSDNTTDATGAGSFGVSVFDASASNTNLIRDADNVGTTLTATLQESKPIVNWLGSGTILHRATDPSFSPGYVSFTWATTNSTDRYCPAMAIGEYAGTAVKDVISGHGVIPFAR